MNQETASETHEFSFTQKDFDAIRTLIYDHAGIKLGDNKKPMVYSRLARRLRATGLASFQDYLLLLERIGGQEWEAFVNSLTTNLTSFFREAHHFPILAEHVRNLGGKRPLRIWCSAASTGEEPYTIAMTLADAFGSLTPPARILATDIDTNVLQTAQAGVYPLERLEKLPEALVQRFFLKGTGRRDGHAKVRHELRELIHFQRLNLLDERWDIRGPYDAIFCRNVMIYFDKDTQRKILEKFAPLLEPHGLLFAGHSESFFHATDLFKLRGKTVYELTQEARTRLPPRPVGTG
ncbi:MAG TPA: CheR family methyltransferase [Methylococcaceae bacterium]|nr:CheR family methyltransferase [Methylococcaceae bacterium]